MTTKPKTQLFVKHMFNNHIIRTGDNMNYEICTFCEHSKSIRINGKPYCEVEEENKDRSYCLDAEQEYEEWLLENHEE